MPPQIARQRQAFHQRNHAARQPQGCADRCRQRDRSHRYSQGRRAIDRSPRAASPCLQPCCRVRAVRGRSTTTSWPCRVRCSAASEPVIPAPTTRTSHRKSAFSALTPEPLKSDEPWRPAAAQVELFGRALVEHAAPEIPVAAVGANRRAVAKVSATRSDFASPLFEIGELRMPAISGKLERNRNGNDKNKGSSMSNDSRIPVIVGVGEITDKPANPADGLEPLALMAEALKRAEQDAGAKLVAQIDSIDLVNLVSWRYEDPARQLCERLGIAPKRAVYGPVGGEGPIRYPARSGAAHPARRERGRRGLRRGSAEHRQQGGEGRRQAAVDAVCRARRAVGAQRQLAASAGHRARRVPADHGLSVLRCRDRRALGPDAARRRCGNPANCGRPSRASPRRTRIRG